VADFNDEDGYQGTATLEVAERSFDVRVELRGYFQPIDGRYHWYGRIAADPALDEVLAAGKRRGTLTTPQGSAPADVGDPDPWGRYRIEGISTPPFESWFSASQPPASDPERELPEHVRMAVIGSGFGGLGAGIKLLEAGIRDFVILERAESVGGTWRDNTYPGCACDVPSHLYSFSFAPNPRWSRSYSGQPEIRAYLEDVADRPGLRARLHFDTAATGAVWQASTAQWLVSTTRGQFLAARYPRPRLVPRRDLPLGPLGPRDGPDRQARRRSRHGRVRDPDRAATAEEGCEARSVPAHARLGHAARRPNDHRR